MFRFTISDLGIFLNKSPVTIRGWERKGLIATLPRVGLNRSLGTEDVRGVALAARKANRISEERFGLIQETTALLGFIEEENG